MFRKVVSTLPFSPALVEQLGLYARGLSQELVKRRLGLVFVILALGVQCFALFRPPEPTHAVAPLNVCPYTNTLKATDAACEACPYNSNLWIQDRGCDSELKLSIDATNLTHHTPAIQHSARADDRIQYNLHTHNTSSETTVTPIEMSVEDLVEYGTVIDVGGGTFDPDTKKVSWGAIPIAAGQTDMRSFMLQLDDHLPATPQAVDNTLAYDCKLTNTYGNTINISVECPPTKVVETALKQLPKIGTSTSLLLSIPILVITAYFYVRTRQLNREIRIIRKDFNTGSAYYAEQ